MRALGRILLLVMMAAVSLGVAGCIHTWTQTYHDYPPEAYTTPGHANEQGQPHFRN